MGNYEVTAKVRIKAEDDTEALLMGCEKIRDPCTYLIIGAVSLNVTEVK